MEIITSGCLVKVNLIHSWKWKMWWVRPKILPLLQAGERYWFPDDPETSLSAGPEPLSPEHSLSEYRRAENSQANVPFIWQR